MAFSTFSSKKVIAACCVTACEANLLQILTKAVVSEGTHIAKGWLCPIKG